MKALAETKLENSTAIPVTIVVPCCNEQEVLPGLAEALTSVARNAASSYEMHFVLVDDGSTDRTWELMKQYFGSFPNAQLLRHATNMGVTASIMDGIRHAQTEIVCSIDSDCTSDPHELVNLIATLGEDVDMVTGSPYHPQGTVLNVPRWRLALSKTASYLYRRILRQKLYTYTSCFRVYRKSVVTNLVLRENGYPGVAEIIGILDLSGFKVAEYPITLTSRMAGESKLKIMNTIIGQLRVLRRLLWVRLFQRDERPLKPELVRRRTNPAL
jgi:glycosyltransferase involved in cell wall biosynthesis